MRSLFILVLFLETHSLFAIDKGIGVLFLTPGSNEKLIVNIRLRPTLKSKVLEIINCQRKDYEGVVYEFQFKQINTDNLLEFEYEKKGMPIMEVAGKWMKVIYGFDKLGEPFIGWIECKKGFVAFVFWREYLKERNLFFESPDSIKFFESPAKNELKFELQTSSQFKYDYTMKPVAVKGNWMKVEVTTPSDQCNMPKSKKTKIFWIKYLNENGRPLVWYFTRGC
ncbi:MAG: hypothetical protein JSU09_16735 [Bacteroidetes bacterium]|nr:hypothetical protein [Bacteroidota bacterium]